MHSRFLGIMEILRSLRSLRMTADGKSRCSTMKAAVGYLCGLTSVIIPVLNEAESIETCIAAARRDYAPDEVEIVVVDGGSSDGTPDLVPSTVAHIRSPRGRAVQMNGGAAASRGEILVFCHADSQLPAGWREAVIEALSRPGVSGGSFKTLILPEVAWILRLHNRMPQLASWKRMHGDQSQFMTRATFERTGGFPELSLMEDGEMSRALHREDPVVPVEAGRARLFSPVRVEILVDVSAAGEPRRARRQGGGLC